MKVTALVLALIVLAAPPVVAQPSGGSWTETKCALYAEAWTGALARFGRDGLGAGFVARHEAFLASGCRGPRDVCPRSPAELALADALTIAAMNQRMASSFLPFACRD